jgi:hypothetical protein
MEIRGSLAGNPGFARRADVSQPLGMHDRDTGLGDGCFR